ncbi:Toll/interleukin-1 receptor domain-containing protein [Tanacetum coccineum]
MKNSRMVQLREVGEKKVLKRLKFLSISNSDSLTTFDFTFTPNLEKLCLYSSTNLVELCMPAICQKLNYLGISHSKLRTFDLKLTPNLETLSLEYCVDFEELHVSVECPNLKFLNVRDILEFPKDIGQLESPEKLHLSSTKIKHLRDSTCMLKYLKSLPVDHCDLLEKLPEDLG